MTGGGFKGGQIPENIDLEKIIPVGLQNSVITSDILNINVDFSKYKNVVINGKNLKHLLELNEVCDKFIKERNITCPECIYQTDDVIVNAYEFIKEICDIVGYIQTID